MKRRLFFSAVVVLLCVIVNLFVGLNDWLTLFGLLGAAGLMMPVVLEFQMGSRALLSNHLKRDGRLYHAVRKPGFVTKIIAFLAAFVLALGFFVSLKGVMISHGAISSLLIIALVTLLLFPWLMPAEERQIQSKHSMQDSNEENLEKNDRKVVDVFEDTAKGYASFVASLVAVILVLNIALAMVLSARDVGVFMTTDITVENFSYIAADAAIGYSGFNEYSRSLINAFILSDHLKLALGNVLFDTFLPGAEKVKYFYVFYFATFLMNLVKLMPLSIGFVVFLGGVRRRSDDAQRLVSGMGIGSKVNWLASWIRLRIKSDKNIRDDNE